ncbi:MAG: 1-acyl-sn-glycerol-3-phosphate acyltransferase, partial [Myxococcota bacterium]
EWFRVEGSRMANQKRIRMLRFWYDDFPRTATRKIKRKDVVDILQELHEAEHAGEEYDPEEEDEWAWLHEEIAGLADVDARDVHASTHFVDDLGFDSLMVVELASELGEHDIHLSTRDLANIYTVGQLQSLIDTTGDSGALVRTEREPIHSRVDEFPIHPALADLGRNALEAGQMKAYDRLFDVEVYGRAHIPRHNPNVIVAANHSSHLDMGLVKYALGDFGRNIRALAAADYFFGNTLYKTYFNNFTNLIPVERSGTMEQALSGAAEAVHRGETILVFPEGTRSTSGKLQDFKRGIGYLAAHERVDVLPLYIEGTYRALPKGQSLPSPTARKLKVYVGPPLDTRRLIDEAGDVSDSELYQYIADKTREAIVELRDGAGRSAGSDEDLEPLFSELNERFEKSNVSDKMSFYFSLGNVDSHKWTVIVDSERCEIQAGKPSGRADCVIKTSPKMFKRIVKDSYVPSMDEFMSGEIKTNDPQLLAQFQNIFSL